MLTKSFLIAAISVSSIALIAVGQDPEPESRSLTRIGTFPGGGLTYNRLFSEETEKSRAAQKKVSEAIVALRKAESDRDRGDARTELASALGEQYDSRMDAYEKHLEEMEKQLNEMRDKLARRRRAKSEMIDLRIQVLEAEADDLGWPSGSSGSFFNTPRALPSWRSGRTIGGFLDRSETKVEKGLPGEKRGR